MKKIPKKCPACGSTVNWKPSSRDSAMASWMCDNPKCRAIGRNREHPEISRGIAMSHLYDGVHCMDKSITHLPCNVQIGILRARHPKG